MPLPGRNVNMVSGTNFPDGDPFLQRQDEPSVAASTRNALHLLAGANDYRTVDLPGLPNEITGDAWLGVFKSFDGGGTWQSTLLPGYPQDTTPEGLASPLKGLQAAADPVVRSGSNGLLYYAGIAFNRGTGIGSKIFVARYIDNNNKEHGDTIAYLGTTVVDIGSSSKFVDKPSMVVDAPRGMQGGRKAITGPACTISQGPAGPTQTVPAGAVYVIYSIFLDNEHGEADENRPVGSPAEGHTKIVLTRSLDCGVTFSPPTVVSDRYAINQGSAAAIDPNTGTLYIAWREFKSKSSPDSILVVRSNDGGKTFTKPTRLSSISPFDQGSTFTSFRTNAYPTIAVDAGAGTGPGRAYVAWSQRGVGPLGDARIVISSSTDGVKWSAPVAVDNTLWPSPDAGAVDLASWRGHQVMPTLTFSAGRLQLVYFDFRKDLSGLFNTFVDEADVTKWNAAHPNDTRTRHTVDVRGVQGLPGDPPAFGPSVQISQYLTGSRHKAAGPGPTQQLQFNPANLPLFAKGTTPFIGDYLDVGATPPFIVNVDGTWRYNTRPSDPSAYMAVWADNRDVRAPRPPHTWADYTPPTFAGSNGSSLFDPSQPLIKCEANQEGMRNQNIYSARLTSGLVLGTLGNNKPLGYVGTNPNGTPRLIQRTFVVFVTNPESVKQSVGLHIASQPPGGQASFLQFKPLIDLAVDIAPKSTISREIYVTSSDKHAAVLVTVTSGASTTIAGSLLLNPDITNPDITNPDITNPDPTNPDITNAEAHALTVSNPDITNPDITNPDITNPDITNPDITNPDITNPDITNPEITNPDITNPDITNPDITNPDITNPDITNPDITNGSLTDITWTVENKGNTATSYQVKLLLRDAVKRDLLQNGFKFQLVVRKLTAAPIGVGCNLAKPQQNLLVANITSAASVTQPDVFVDPTDPAQFSTIVNPDITNPDITNATLALAPGETGKVTLRVLNPQKTLSSANNDDALASQGNGGPSAAETSAVAQGLGGLLADLAKVAMASSAQAVDTADANAGIQTPKIDASIPLVVTTSLPDGVRTTSYTGTIQSVGGTAPRTLSILTPATFPPGLTLDGATGVVSGVPTAAGTFTFTVQVQDADLTASATDVTLRIFDPIVVGTVSIPRGVVNQPYSTLIVAAGGLPSYGWFVSGGSLPAGVTLALTGVLSGTPTQSGSFTFTASVGDSAAPSQIRSVILTLDITPAAVSQNVATLEDTPVPITLAGVGAPASSFTFTISSPPAHGTLSGSGQSVTYTPASNFTSGDSFAFTVTQGALTSAPATVSITVTSVNDAPVATPQTVNTALNTPIGIVLTGTDADNDPLTFSLSSQPPHGTLSGAPPNVTYTPKANFSGNDSFTFTANDGSLTSGPGTVTVVVGPPPPTSADVSLGGLTDSADPVRVGTNVTYSTMVQDSGPAAATNVALTFAYPAGGLTFASFTSPQGTCTGGAVVTCALGAMANGAALPVTVTFTAINQTGTVNVTASVTASEFDYDTVNNTASQTTTVAPNQNPTALNDNVATNEDAAVVVTVLANDTDPENDPLTVSAVSAPAHGTAVKNLNNTVTYTPALNYSGGDSFTYTISDGHTGTATGTVNVVVNAANDAPSFTKGADQSVNEDAGLQVVPAWATAISKGPADESAQALDFIVSNDNSALFSAQPAVAADGTLTYTSASNANGSATVSVQIHDDGGTANGGVDTSAAQTFTITVTAVNDAPSFVKGADQTVAEDSGAQTAAGWASAISAGPPDEAGQALNFIVSNDDNALFSTQPAVAANGTLTYTPASSTSGSAIVSVQLQDNGGVANGGADTSAAQTFVITVLTQNNHAPVADAQAVPALEDVPQPIVLTASDPDGDPLVLSIASGPSHGVLSGTPPNVTYTAAPDYTGLDSFTFQASDAGGIDALPGLVSRWPLDTNANDTAGGNSATGISGIAFVPATVNQGVTFAPGGFIDVADAANLRLQTLTLSAWVKPQGPNTTADTFGDNIVAKWTLAGGGAGSVSLGWRASDGRFVLVVNSATPTLVSTNGFPAGTFHHVAATYDGAMARLYVDGIAEGQVALATAIVYDAQTWAIGSSAFRGVGFDRTWKGVIDDLRVYSRALSAPEVARIAENGAVSAPATVSITVGPVNDAPSFTKGANQAVLEDAGPQAVAGWASAISAGPSNESLQTVSFIVSNDNGSLFSSQPAVAANGTLTYTPAANANGAATVTVQVQDDGGTSNGGVNTSASQTFTIAVTPVNDAPTFTKGANQTVVNTAGPQTIPAWATNITAGATNESAQALDFIVSNNSNALFSSQPAIAANGTLTYTPAPGTSGGATVTVQLHDNGGTANGGTDTSAAQTFTITVTSGNQPPVATDDTAITFTGQPVAIAPTGNDTDPDVASASLLATYRPMAPGAPFLANPNEIGVVNSTGLAYFSGGNLSAEQLGNIGILDTNTNTITGIVPLPVPGAQNLARVNQTTGIVYFRSASATMLTAIDGRPASPTFNTAILSLSLASIQSMAIDETRGLLYVSTFTSTFGTAFQGRITILDVNPANPTFHQVVGDVVLPGSPGAGQPQSLVVNTVTNKIYVAVTSGTTGVYVMDGVSRTLSLIASTNAAQTLVVNEAANLVYATTTIVSPSPLLYAIDGATNTRMASIALPANGFGGAIDTRLAVHQGTGHVYVRLAEYPNNSRLVIVDGNRTSATFNTILTSLVLGHETNSSLTLVDEAANRVVTTSRSDFQVSVIDAVTNAIVGTVQYNQASGRMAIDAVHHRAYVSMAEYVGAIDLATGTAMATIPAAIVSGFPIANPITHVAYVPVLGTTSTLSKFDDTGLVGPVAGLPHGSGQYVFTARNPVTNRFYSVNGFANLTGTADGPQFVSVIDGATNAVIANIPAGTAAGAIATVAVNDVTNKIYVGNSFVTTVPGGITVIDGATNTASSANISQIPQNSTVSGLIAVGRDMAVNTTTNKVYFRITTGSPTTIGVLDGNTDIATALPASLGPINIIRVNPVLNRIYVGGTASNGQNQIHVLDGANDQEIATLNVGFPSDFLTTQSYLAVNRTTGRVFVADFDESTITVVDGATNAVLTTIQVDYGPTSVAVNESTNRIYVGNAYLQTLTIIDGATLRIAATIQLPLRPIVLSVDESISRIYASNINGEAGVMVIDDPGTLPPAVTSVTQGAHGSVVINADGTVTYTPNAGYTGSDSYTYTATDALGASTTGTVNVTILSFPSITTASLPDTQVGQPYSQTLAVAGGTAPYSWSLFGGSVLPGGLTLNTVTGAISGTPTQSGTFTFTVQMKDSTVIGLNASVVGLDDRHTFTLTIGPPVITTTGLPNATINTPYSQQLLVGGATGAVTWSLNTNNSPLLSWLSISSGGVLSGTPPNYGTTPSFTVTATDSLNQQGSRALTLFVTGPLDIVPTALREGVVLETQPALPIVGGNGTKTAALTAGSLPPGVTLLSSGSFSGTPTRHGTFNFTVQVQDCQSSSCTNQVTPQTITRNLTWRVSPKDQQGSSATQTAISFGGLGGRRIAQTVTVGAQGQLTGIGLRNISCPNQGPVTIDVQRLTLAGLPDGTTIASGVSFNSNFSAITVAPSIDLPIGATFAFLISSPTSCTLTNASITDNYNAGDAYVDAGAGWVSLFSTDGRYDVPSFVTLIQPALDVAYLTRARSTFSATLLNNGKVLLPGSDATADLYDPATNTVTATGSMSAGRSNHTATLLTSGKVLIVGGRDTTNTRLATAELYDPATGTFSLTGSMATERDFHAATRLADGRVLIAGGTSTSIGSLQSVEIYDPGTGSFSSAGNMTTGRSTFTATLLTSGKVLLAGGFASGSNTKSAELYDPIAGTFTATTGNMVTFRGRHTATLLTDGRVLLATGESGVVLNTAEIYDPATDSFTATGNLASARRFPTATLLADGSVLVAGGLETYSSGSYILPLATMERWLPGSGTFVPAGEMEARRQGHAAVRLANDKVLLAGGSSQSWMSGDSAETYDPTTALSLSPASVPDGSLNQPYPPVVFSAAGGTGPYQITQVSGQLPTGMTYDAQTFTLSGTPSVQGTFVVGMKVTDSASHASTQSLAIRVGALVITTPGRLPDAPQNRPYSVQLTSTGGVAPVVWSIPQASSPLPAGLTLTSSGVISGSATTLTGATFVVRAVDATGQIAFKGLTMSIVSPLVITTTTLPESAVMEANTFCLARSNGIGTVTWSVVSTSPAPGINLQTNGCNVAPTATGTFAFTAQVTDQASPPQVVTQAFTVRVSAREQQGGSQTQPTISFGGASGRKFAQVVTVGANGTLNGLGFTQTVACASSGAVTIDVQRLTLAGLPDGNTIATGTATTFFNGVALVAPMQMGVDDRLAFVISSPAACTISNVSATDNYQAGDAYVDSGSGWVSLFSTDGRYDLPFRTLIQPAANVTYMNRGRSGYAATLLNNGKVLLTGSDNTAELYDPATQTTTLTGNMSIARQNHTATLLADGTVLVAGGISSGVVLASAEIYDPSAGTFSPTAGPMTTGREVHTATRLNDGRVLITGGVIITGPTTVSLQSAELYDPASKTFSSAGNMTTARQVHNATLLQSGKVLIASGFLSGSNAKSAELYDPSAGTFTATGGSMTAARGWSAATRLADGRVLISGGQTSDIVNTAEVYDPATDSFTATGSMASRRHQHTLTLLADGSVLVAGGYSEVGANSYVLGLATMERYVPGTNSFVAAGGTEARRASHTATRLPNDTVLIAGGAGQSWMSGNTAELYDVTSTPALTPTSLPDGQVGVVYPNTTLAGSGGTGPPYQIDQVSGSLPPGLIYDSPTRTVSGTPTATGIFTFGMRVTDAASQTNVQSLTIRSGSLNVITSPYRLIDGALNHAYDVLLTATGTAPIVWSAAPASVSSLPPGLSVGSTGHITGTPTALGYYNFEVRAVDATGQVALKTLSISIQNPLAITTTTLGDGVVPEGYNTCLSTSGGIGTKTWSKTSGTLPTGVSFGSNGCFSGTVNGLGTFNFTVQVTDQASPSQTDTKALAIAVVSVVDQSSPSTGAANLSFGGAPGSMKVAERVMTGISGMLRAVRATSFVCTTAGTTVTLEIQGVTGTGAPDGSVLASGSIVTTSTSSVTLTIPLAVPIFLPADAPFAAVFSADNTCNFRPTTFDPGEAYVFSAGSWWRLRDIDARYDLSFQTLVAPSAGITFMTRSRGNHLAVTLNDGRVLMFGNGDLTAEIYDPAAGTFTQTGNMNVGRFDARALLLGDGDVLVTGGYTCPTSCTSFASAELFHPTTGIFELLPSTMVTGRAYHSMVALSGDRVLLTGGYSYASNQTLQTAEIYDRASRTFTSAGTMTATRYAHTSTLLNDGRVLVAGGYGTATGGETFDPITTSFTATAQPMATPRSYHTATKLLDGRVLLAGGYAISTGQPAGDGEVFDPIAGSFTSTGPMNVRRIFHAASLLVDGSVLLAGGQTDTSSGQNQPQATAERYVPGTGFTGASSMLVARYYPTATLLASGKVLIAGTFGWSATGGRTAEIYDPATAPAFAAQTPPAGSNGAPYAGFTLTPQGGSGGPYTITQVSGTLPTGLVYSANTHDVQGTPTQSGVFRVGFSVTDSQGHAASDVFIFAIDQLTLATTFLPTAYLGIAYSATLVATGTGPLSWSIIGSLPAGLSLVGNTIVGTPTSATGVSFAIRVTDASGQIVERTLFLSASYTIDQQSSYDTTRPVLNFGLGVKVGQQVRTGISGQLLGVQLFNAICPANTTVTAELQGTVGGVPNGVTLTSGSAIASSFGNILFAAQPFFAAEQTFALVLSADASCQLYPTTYDSYAGGEGSVFNGTWQTLAQFDGRHDIPFRTIVQPSAGLFTMVRYRGTHTATTLADGRVLMTGGSDQSAEIYDPATGGFSQTGNMNEQRQHHKAMLLDDGTVLITGGYNFTGSNNSIVYLASAELYHPNTGTFEALASPMTATRYDHTATRLSNGQVLITGGSGLSGVNFVNRQSAELYDQTTRAFTAIANMASARSAHTATLLADLRVLLVGGYSGNGAEVFDPITSSFTAIAQPAVAFRARHSATLLQNGNVLIAGGSGSPAATSAELFDAATNTFSNAGALLTPRVDHTATLLNDGSVLLAGGLDDTGPCCPIIPPAASMERYVPGSGFTSAGSMIAERYVHTATLLANGKVLLAGTFGWSQTAGRTGELFDPSAPIARLTAPMDRNGTRYPALTLLARQRARTPFSTWELTYSRSLIGIRAGSIAWTATPKLWPGSASGPTPAKADTTVTIEPIEQR